MNSAMISLDSIQPSCSPRSSAICNAPMPIASAKNPNQSKRRSKFFLVSSMNTSRPSTVNTPNGRLTKNTQCQEYVSVSHAPSEGPMIGPIITPMPQIAIALARSCNA